MASVITFAPIAAQLARSVSLDQLFPRSVVEDMAREHRSQIPGAGEAKLPSDVEPFFGHYCAVTRAAVWLLGSPAFERLARFHEQIQEEYVPGGPPMSPVYDSFAMQFVLGAVPQGIGNETPYSVLARLLLRDPSRARFQSMAQSLAEARVDLYRVKSVSGHYAQVELVRGGSMLSIKLVGPFLRTGDFALMRVDQWDGQHFVADSPYLLRASEADWHEHLTRVLTRQQGAVNASAPQKASKLSGKEQARRRQKDKSRASRNEPEEVIRRYLRSGPSERHWFDYIMDAFSGERRGIVFLAGVPDRPALLPHSTAYQGSSQPELHPMAELRAELLQIAEQEGLIDLAKRELSRLREPLGAQAVKLSPNEKNLIAAYATLGLRAKDGSTVLTRFERSPAAKNLRPELRRVLESIEHGWFAVLRVERIHLDEGLEVFDLLRRKRQRVSERSATRQLGLGDLVLGWLCKDPAGILTLEGGIAHVPSLATESIESLVEALRRAVPKARDEQEWNRDAAALVLPLVAGIVKLRGNPPLPKLMNTSGDQIEIVTGHYRIRDRARVVAALAREFLDDGKGNYSWVNEAGTSLARLELSTHMLRVQVNSRKRMRAVQERLDALLGDAIARSLESHEDVEQAVRTRKRRAGKGAASAAPLELPPELAAELHRIVLAKIRSTLDEPIPQFKGKTLRQLARNAKGRPDAVSWLREQERLLRSNPQLSGLDLRSVWDELALPFQGQETDPPL